MTVYKFKVSFEDYDDVVREIDILSDQSFMDLHHCILRSVKFVADAGASFFMSNDRWVKGHEIALDKPLKPNGEQVTRMQDALLRDYIIDPHQKIFYLFDFVAQWNFHVELVRILPSSDLSVQYPVCMKSTGVPPKQKTDPPVPKGVTPKAGETEDARTLPDDEAGKKGG